MTLPFHLPSLATLLTGSLLASLLASLPARAAFVLYDTATDNAHDIIAQGALDSHWSGYRSDLSSFSPTRVNNGLPGAVWLAENTTAGSATGWLSTNAGSNDVGSFGFPGESYTYVTRFNLTGLDASTAFINLCWSMDDYDTLGIMLNGITVPGSTANYQGFAGWAAISIPAGSNFLPGINTLEFVVGNAGGPTGIMVDFKDYGTVPEPSSAAMAAGALGLLLQRRRRRV